MKMRRRGERVYYDDSKGVMVSDSEIVEIDGSGKAVVRDKMTGKYKEEKMFGSRDEAVAEYSVRGYEPVQKVTAGVEEVVEENVRRRYVAGGDVAVEELRDLIREGVEQLILDIEEVWNRVDRLLDVEVEGYFGRELKGKVSGEALVDRILEVMKEDEILKDNWDLVEMVFEWIEKKM